jgi:hypothetical protein
MGKRPGRGYYTRKTGNRLWDSVARPETHEFESMKAPSLSLFLSLRAGVPSLLSVTQPIVADQHVLSRHAALGLAYAVPHDSSFERK